MLRSGGFFPAKDYQLVRAAPLTKHKSVIDGVFYWKLECSSSAICCEVAPLVKPGCLFPHFHYFFISFWEIQKLNSSKSEKLETHFYEFLSFSLFRSSSFWISRKLIHKNDEKLKQTPAALDAWNSWGRGNQSKRKKTQTMWGSHYWVVERKLHFRIDEHTVVKYHTPMFQVTNPDYRLQVLHALWCVSWC
jgi:hypothetical protein